MISVLALPRSILTEKIARRGYHVNREYEVDPLQALVVRDVMATELLTVSPQTTAAELYEQLPEGHQHRRQRLYPVIGDDSRMVGVLTWSDVLRNRAEDNEIVEAATLARPAIVAYPHETLRIAADRMIAGDHGVLPVVDRDDPSRLVGLISQFDLLAGHERVLVEERHRERPLSLRPAGVFSAVLPSRRGG
jgi:chloride channel protein, CIC family